MVRKDGKNVTCMGKTYIIVGFCRITFGSSLDRMVFRPTCGGDLQLRTTIYGAKSDFV